MYYQQLVLIYGVRSLIAEAGSGSAQVWTFIGVFVVALGAFAGIKYQRSGKIKRSEAETLWQENNDLRGEMRQEIKDLKDEVKTHTNTITEHEATIRKLREENWTLRQDNYRMKRRIADLEPLVAKVAECEKRLRMLEG
jgi:septal ring factor EnvC (AmiA/AmiB activator)